MPKRRRGGGLITRLFGRKHNPSKGPIRSVWGGLTAEQAAKKYSSKKR